MQVMEDTDVAQRIYRSLYDRFWRITNQDCQVNDYPIRGIGFVSLGDLSQFDLEPDQAMEVQAAMAELRQAGLVRRLSEDEEAQLLEHLHKEGESPRGFFENKDYIFYVGPTTGPRQGAKG